jgi:hypothetical protein
MRVRVKDGQRGWYGNKLHKGKDLEAGKAVSDEFDLVERKHSVTGEKITVGQQFSDTWMEKVDVKKKPGPRPKAPEPSDS